MQSKLSQLSVVEPYLLPKPQKLLMRVKMQPELVSHIRTFKKQMHLLHDAEAIRYLLYMGLKYEEQRSCAAD